MKLGIFARNRFLFWFLFVPAVLAISVFMLRTNMFKARIVEYDTIAGKRVSEANFYSVVDKAPKSIAYDVNRFFNKYPEAKALLLEQDVDLANIGNILLNAKKFFNRYGIKDFGKLNYVFRLPGTDYLVKICGPNNRFFYAIYSYGICGVNLYLRQNKRVHRGEQEVYSYVDFYQEKERIKKTFYLSCNKDILIKPSSQAYIKEIMNLVAGALPQAILRGFVYSTLEQKFLTNTYNVADKTVEDVFSDILEYTFYLVGERCYKRGDLEKRKFVDSYNIANRVLSCKRFEEAIELFKLDKLAKPPKTYIVNLNPDNPDSCVDKDVVLVQEILEENLPFRVFLQDKKLLNAIFTYDAVKQLLKAMKYAGLWDITGENIRISKRTGKITYIDFEPKNDILPDEWFNKSERKRKMNLGYLMLQFTKRFEPGTPQRAAVENFVQNSNDIDLDWYNREYKKQLSRHKFQQRGWSMEEGLLCTLLRYKDDNCEQVLALRRAIGKKLEALA